MASNQSIPSLEDDSDAVRCVVIRRLRRAPYRCVTIRGPRRLCGACSRESPLYQLARLAIALLVGAVPSVASARPSQSRIAFSYRRATPKRSVCRNGIPAMPTVGAGPSRFSRRFPRPPVHHMRAPLLSDSSLPCGDRPHGHVGVGGARSDVARRD